MARYNFFISYCKADGFEYTCTISKLLTEKGYSVWMGERSPNDGIYLLDAIPDAIANCDCFLPVITERYNDSELSIKELDFAIMTSKNRAKKIIPLLFTEKISAPIQFLIARFQYIQISSPQEIPAVIDKIDSAYGNELKSALLYEKLTEYKAIKNNNKMAVTICDLIELTLQKWENISACSFKEMQNICKELYRLYKELENYTGQYDEESRETVHIILKAIDKAGIFLRTACEPFGQKKLFYSYAYFSAVAIRIIYSDKIIRSECADIITYGDAVAPCPTSVYIENQAPFVKAYIELYEKADKDDSLSDEDIVFIEGTKEFIFDESSADLLTRKPRNRDELNEDEPTENDDILLSIAKFMQEGNKLFDILQSRGIAGDFLSCLLTSYERLKNYCEVIGAKNVAADCVERIVEIRNAISQTSPDGTQDEKAEHGIKSLLGFTIAGSGNYDVFISFKNEDSDLAERIYSFCQQNLKVPFWSKRTLPQLSKSEYEDAIYDAIRKSRHFVVVLSNLKYLEANWIKREMAAFDRAITEGRKQGSNFVFVVTDDVYKEIIDCNKMCLDERYCGYQIIKMSEFEETLMSYII